MFDSQAHRGGRDARPENTLYSYLYGMEIGANIECDMQLARDGIVMSHNPVLNPDITRDIHGSYLRTGIYDIRLMTIEEIKSFDVGAINPESETSAFTAHRLRSTPKSRRLKKCSSLRSILATTQRNSI